MTIRQRKYVKAIEEGKGVKEAARIAEYSPATIEGAPQQPLKSPEVQSAIQRAMEKKGLTDDKLMDVLAEGLDCKKTVSVGFVRHDVPDYSTRHNYLETGLKLKGYLKKDEGNGAPFIFQVIRFNGQSEQF